MAVAMVAFTACGNKKKSAQQADGKAEQTFEQVQLEAHIQMQVDSIAAMFADKLPSGAEEQLMSGKMVLSEKAKQIKPTYLIDPASTQKLSTLMQKYRAIAMLTVDMKVAEAYDMAADEYKAALSKLIADINDPAFKQFNASAPHSAEKYSDDIRTLYQNEAKNGRLNLFWELNGAIMIETLYLATRNSDMLLKYVTDDDAANLTLRLFLITQSVDQLVAYYPELESMSKSLEPLQVLNSMDKAELRSQLIEMKGQLEVIRNGLLK